MRVGVSIYSNNWGGIFNLRSYDKIEIC